MRQIFMNYLVIIIIPFLVGVFLRFLFRKRTKAWLITLITALLALAAFIVERTIPAYGSELYGLLVCMAASLLIGSLLIGTISRIVSHRK